MTHPQFYEGRYVVWGRNGCFETFHLAELPRGVFTIGKSKTLCGRLVQAPVIASRVIEEDIKSGIHNCPKCFKKK